MWQWHSAWGGGDWAGMVLMMALVWGAIFLLVIALVRTLALGGRAPEPRDSAEDEARRAYARGDLDRERFLQITTDLREGRPR